MGSYEKILWKDICPEGESLHIAQAVLKSGNPIHTHDFHECFYVESGKGKQIIPSGILPLAVAELYFVKPEHAHSFESSPSAPLKVRNIAFNSAILEELIHPFEFVISDFWKDKPEPYGMRLTSLQSREFHQLVDQVTHSPRDVSDCIYMLSGLNRILRQNHYHNTTEPLPYWLLEALPHFADPDNLQAGLPRLIELCGRSQEHISRSFKKYLKKTTTEWLSEQRIKYARILLETTDMPIIEISIECGMPSLSHFHKHFKSMYSTTPLQYRKKTQTIQLS